MAQIAREDVDTEQLLGTGYRKLKDGKDAEARPGGQQMAAKGGKAAKGKAKEEVLTDRPAASSPSRSRR
ncbi:UvrABC system protein B OS=Streptomyces antimycoticus OX=68175 GN=uvrB PE=3 SV=1 [Streptomyces antimycoticus]